MKLVKVVLADFKAKLEDNFQFEKIIGDTTIAYQDIVYSEVGSLYCFSAEKSNIEYNLADNLIYINKIIFNDLILLIEDVINILCIAKNLSRCITSANPSYFLRHENQIDFNILNLAEKIQFELPQLASFAPVHLFDFEFCYTNLLDRLDGVRIFAEAISTSTCSDRYRELFRFFEIAFKKENRGLIIPLTAFLMQNKFLNYTQSEVESWIKIRHKITHANHIDGFLINRNLYSVMARIEQGAIDVLFNKNLWNQNSSSRRQIYSFDRGVNDNNQVFAPPNCNINLSIIGFDETKTFPLNSFGGFDLSKIPEALWYQKKQSIDNGDL